MIPSYNASLHQGRLTWQESLPIAHAVGFSAIDLPLRLLPPDAGDQLRAANLRGGACDLPVEFRKDDATFQADLAALDGLARQAVALGCPRMATWVPCWCEDSFAETRARWLARFRAIATVLAARSIRLGLEFIAPMHLRQLGRAPFIWRMHDMLEFAVEAGDNVGLLLDSFHWHLSGATGDDIRRAGRERFVHVHLNDAPRKRLDDVRDDERLLPGEGAIDLATFFAALRDIEYSDAVSIEILGTRLAGESPADAAKLAALAAMRVIRALDTKS